MQKGGSIRAMIDGFTDIFGDKLDTNIPAIMVIVKSGKVTIGGLEFIIKETKESFDLEIPSINVVYTHMVGSDTHNIIESVEQINEMIKQMEDYIARGVGLILTTHDLPRGTDTAAIKIGYLKKVKDVALKSGNQKSFIAGVRRAFPKYKGEEYLKMTAGALFKNSAS
jgi:xylose isomerase